MSVVRVLPGFPSRGLVAIYKPAGVAVHGPDGLLTLARAEIDPSLHLVHRLDRETSGVLLLARGDEVLRSLHAIWATHVEKVYWAITRGAPEPPDGTIDVPLLEHRTSKRHLLERAVRAAYGSSRAGHLLSGRRVRAIPPLPPPGRTIAHPAGRPAVTAYRVLKRAQAGPGIGEVALVELRPRSGRMHQIRVHLQSIGTPILGDRFYDDRRTESDGAPFLHAASLTIRNPPGEPDGTLWRFSSNAELPKPFRRVGEN
jgi:23S rRNA-/tRNA-specific pseudouridylate synthase